jgi:hypothetical protein
LIAVLLVVALKLLTPGREETMATGLARGSGAH